MPMPVMPTNMLMQSALDRRIFAFCCYLVSVFSGRVLPPVIGCVRDMRVALARIVVVMMMVPMVSTMVTVLMLMLMLMLVQAVMVTMVLISVATLFAPQTRMNWLDFILTRARCKCCGTFSQILSRLIR